MFQQLKLLEKEYGVKIYEKIGRGIKLTETGQLFLGHTEEILHRIERLDDILRSESTKKKEYIRVGGSYGPSASFLPSVIASFKKTHPQVQPALRTEISRAVEQMVTNADLDVGMIIRPSYLPSLNYEHGRNEEFLAFAPANHPLARKRRLTLEEFGRTPLVIIRRVARRTSRTDELLKQIATRGIEPNIAMVSDSAEAVRVAVKNGLGLGLLHRDFVEPDIRQGKVKTIYISDFERSVQSFIIYHKEKALSPAAQDLLTLLRQRCQKQQKERRV